MKKRFLEAGVIVNTHGIQGEVKIVPWADDPSFLTQFKTLYINDNAYQIETARIHKSFALVKFKGIDDVVAGQAMREKIVSIDREGMELEEGTVFISDLIGLPVFADGEEIGTLTEVLNLPANDVYVVKGTMKYMIPAVSEFLEEVDVEKGIIRVKLLEGMGEN